MINLFFYSSLSFLPSFTSLYSQLCMDVSFRSFVLSETNLFTVPIKSNLAVTQFDSILNRVSSKVNNVEFPVTCKSLKFQVKSLNLYVKVIQFQVRKQRNKVCTVLDCSLVLLQMYVCKKSCSQKTL